ncbi:alpha-2-macroglobulin family protein [Chitinimonas koreensis]|uniref:alpha-2-macroglobulin family protein n=1 Tax=Chitinimonas koreensis TaxID=356302 RepID=UPI000414091D|nr:MG2 domain-containing protein [Chitinimonas koreensis]QNM95832.1 alpha-2-macroglobulin [Chitinimonas koreensis]
MTFSPFRLAQAAPALLLGLAAAHAAEVVSFSPQGAVREVRQAKAAFSDSMVRFGDPRLADPFEVACGEEKGSGRWIDDRTWVYDFVRDLPAATQCRFTLKPATRTLAGAALPPAGFAFSTGGPEPTEVWPENWQPINENQVFIVAFGAAPTAQSLAAKARCEVEGVRERLPAVALAAEERDKLFTGYFGKDRTRWPLNGQALRCQRPLPADAAVQLVFDAGLAAANGASLREPMRYEFRVQSRFTAWLGCERTRDKAGCVPIAPIELRFTSAVPAASAAAVTLTGPDGKRWTGEAVGDDDNATAEDAAGRPVRMARSVRFKPPFPEGAAFKLALPAELRDEFGRPLANAREFPLAFKTDRFPALAKFAAEFGIVEKAVGTLPVTVRNVGEAGRPEPRGVLDSLVEIASGGAASGLGLPYRQINVKKEADIVRWYRALRRGAMVEEGQDGRAASLLAREPAAQRLRLPAPSDDRAAEVIGIPLPPSGLTVVEVESARLGQRLLQPVAPMRVAAGALVTNLSVHFRRGLDDALVWVTTLDRGWLVNGAIISILDCKGRTLASGKTDKQGIWQYAKPLPAERYDCPLYVFARQGEDVGFVSSEWDQGIEPWRFGISTERDRDQRRAFHAVLDRGLYRAGETVSMKLFAREKTAAGFGALAAERLPDQLRLTHLGSDDSVVLPLRWQGGAAEASWKVPAEAKLGSYLIGLERKKGKETARLGDAGQFSVAEFRVPLMRGTLKLPVDPVAVERLDVVAQVQYLAGGPAAGEPVKLRAALSRAGGRSLDDFDGFYFSSGDVAPEVLGGAAAEGDGEQTLETRSATLDKAGGASLAIAGWRKLDGPAWLRTELEYRDPNGEVQTAAAATTLWPAALQPGLKLGSARPDGTVPIEAALASLAGKPLAGRALRIEGWLRQSFSHRKRLVGGFYSYDNQTRYQPLGELCKGATDVRGRYACTLPAKYKGEIVLRLAARDDAGRTAYSHGEVYVYGDGEGWYGGGDGDRIDLLADKKQYEPGETASLRVAMPFREGTALIAVEREKVLEWRTQTITAANPVVKVPLKPNYGPNVYVSVMVVRGRVADPAATALVDLARPAYKLGIAKLRVGSRAYALDVKVTADKPLYQVRDKAKVTVAVKTADGKPLPKGAEVALAAVDEGLLALRRNDSWQLLEAMLGERGYGFTTSTAQGQVIGRRHFGRKAVPVGGGGGRGGTRELFDTLLLWKARVTLDARGEARVEVPLNDSLTSFRIVAVASAGSDRFGSGETSIRASKDVMLFSGLARTVREGDRFEAGFTVRNTTRQPLKVKVAARAEGLPALPPQTVELAAGAARELVWPVSVPVAAQRLAWQVDATGEDGRRYDGLAIGQKVEQAVPVRVLQATLTQLAPDYSLPLARPADALPGRGGIEVSLSPSLAAALDGVEAYFRDYPYSCLEQQTSKAIGLGDEAGWRAIVGRLDGYLDGDGFAKYFPSSYSGSPVLTAHLLTVSAESGWALPETGLARMKTALAGYAEGRLRVQDWPSDSTRRAIYRLDAVAALARHEAARPAMLDGLVLEPNRWPTSTVLDWIAILDRVAEVPKRAERLKEARQILAARLDLSGTTLNFSGSTDWDAWWMMDSVDADAARVLLDGMAVGLPKVDLGRIARGVVGRQRHGHWDTTTANVWGALALRRFAAEVEAGQPGGVTVAKLGSEQRFDWAGAAKGGTLRFGWPDSAGALTLAHQGQGKPWAIVQARAAVPLKAPLASGYRVDKQWQPVEAAGKGYARGEVWRVRLTIDAQADMNWVAVNDPIPAGAQLLGRGFGTDSALLARKEGGEGAWPVFEERGEAAYKAYYDWLPKGRHVLEYTVRLNTRGEFALPPTRVEALYAPERFGEAPNPILKVD